MLTSNLNYFLSIQTRYKLCWLSLYTNICNQLLNAICVGLQDSEQSIHVRHAAISAMYNSLEFTKSNFDRDAERHHIMQVDISISPDQQFKLFVDYLSKFGQQRQKQRAYRHPYSNQVARVSRQNCILIL